VLTEKTKDAVSAVADTVGQKARDVASGVGQTASSLGHKAEEATSAVGNQMQSLAGTIREKGPQDGIMGSATSSLAGTLERGGRYLQEEGLSGMGEEFTNLIRRNPIPALLAAMGVGYLIARATRS
jgi:hypothetical protein